MAPATSSTITVHRIATRPHLSAWTLLCLGGALLAEILSHVA